MNKEEAIKRLTTLEAEVAELKKIIESPEQKSKEERFWELILKTTDIKIDKRKYPNSTFGFLGETCLWEYNSKTGYLWLSYSLIWSVFETDPYNLKYNDIQSFIKKEVEEHFKCKEGVTKRCGCAVGYKVEEHFKYKVGTVEFARWRSMGVTPPN